MTETLTYCLDIDLDCTSISFFLIAKEWVCSAEYSPRSPVSGAYIGWGNTLDAAFLEMCTNRARGLQRSQAVANKNRERAAAARPMFNIDLGDL